MVLHQRLELEAARTRATGHTADRYDLTSAGGILPLVLQLDRVATEVLPRLQQLLEVAPHAVAAVVRLEAGVQR